MSRYTISHPRYLVSVGWDRPLNTYFVSVIDEAAIDEEGVVIWLGVTANEFTQVESFLRAFRAEVAAHTLEIEVTAELIERLIQDQKTEGDGSLERPESLRHILQA